MLAPAAGRTDVSLTEIPAILTWLDDDGLANELHESWLLCARSSLDRLLNETEIFEPERVERCRMHLSNLDDRSLHRFVLAPETTFRTVWRRSASMRESLEFLEKALIAERVEAGWDVPDRLSAWSALGDLCITGEGRVWRAPTIDGLPPADFDSPFACHLDLSGEEYTIEKPRAPISGEARVRTLQRLENMSQGLADTGAGLTTFITSFTKTLILQADTHDGFSSGSNGDFVGRSAIANPHSELVDECDLADALVHESIHGLLYMHEAQRKWVTMEALYDSTPRVVSPWSGTKLPLRSFLQACFVWYGLANFWAQAMQRDGFPHHRCRALLTRAASGFLIRPMNTSLADFVPGLSEDVPQAIKAMQDDIRSLFRSEG